jgi:hypothetical protein
MESSGEPVLEATTSFELQWLTVPNRAPHGSKIQPWWRRIYLGDFALPAPGQGQRSFLCGLGAGCDAFSWDILRGLHVIGACLRETSERQLPRVLDGLHVGPPKCDGGLRAQSLQVGGRLAQGGLGLTEVHRDTLCLRSKSSTLFSMARIFDALAGVSSIRSNFFKMACNRAFAFLRLILDFFICGTTTG